LHYSWFLIALLIVFSLSSEYHLSHPAWSNWSVWPLAVTTALLFFLSLLLHELSHSLVARTYGFRVREITLFALGGVSQIEKDAPNAKAEFWIAAIGPAASFLISLVCLGTVAGISGGHTLSPTMTMVSWLGSINFGLACFNLHPGYPLDGGRILRAIIWWKTDNLERSTRIATRVGQTVASLFIAIGIVGYFYGGRLASLWTAFIGWFLLQAARESYLEVSLKKILAGVKVCDVMTPDVPTIDGHMSVEDFVEQELLRTGRRCYIVAIEGSAVGMITPLDIRPIARADWHLIALESVMRPFEKLHTLTPGESLMQGIEDMNRQDINQLPVILNGHLEGILSREDILRFLQTQVELQNMNGSAHVRT
jgi:Zn-dependent protease/predicted transcriptional regulator